MKGDRLMHFYDKKNTSFKIDVRGEKRIWGLEEFSIQKPITRNYIYEYIFHKVLESNDLISLKYFFNLEPIPAHIMKIFVLVLNVTFNNFFIYNLIFSMSQFNNIKVMTN